MPFLRPRCSHRLIFEYWRNFLLPNTPDCVPQIKFKPLFLPSNPSAPYDYLLAVLLSLLGILFDRQGADTFLCA